ncbi:hypothetical protein BKA70DRAFT_1307884 [Coprinopsis sp. MPI-PUGE-AT-0042]|nr:hypothetical protein BKA70DRAFT_1307884 [Coprinopsis sp. MPI-PUGE-AT-0042]
MDTDDGFVTDTFTGDEAEVDEFSTHVAAIENDVVSPPPSPSLPLKHLSDEERSRLHLLSRLTCPRSSGHQNGAVSYDVLSVILEHLSLSYGETLLPRRKMFQNLCMVSKLFFEVAITFLWSDLDSMIPLLSLFPSFKKMGDGIYYLYGETSQMASSIERFKYYARLVRSITIGLTTGTRYKISSQVWITLTQKLGSQPILPSLKKLTWGETLSQANLPCLFSLVTRSVTYVALRGTALLSNHSLLRACLIKVVEDAPYCRRLWLRCKSNSRRNSGLPALATIIGHMKSLEDLEVELQYDAQRHTSFLALMKSMGGLPDKATLTITSSQPPSHQVRFSVKWESDPISGARVTLCGLSTDMLHWVTACPSLSEVGTIFLNLRNQDESKVDAIIEYLAQHTPNLKELEISMLDRQEEPVFLHGRSLKTILKCCAALKKVDIQVPIVTSPDVDIDDFIDTLARFACSSSLTTLYLPLWNGQEPSLRSLSSIAIWIPQLQHLDIPFNSSKVATDGIDPSRANGYSSPCRLSTLGIRDSRSKPFRPREIRSVAVYLDLLFPKLKSITYHAGSGISQVEEQKAEVWETVGLLLRDFQERRERR